MARIFEWDYETASRMPLRGKDAVGQYRYACDPSTKILMFAIAEGEEAPAVWDSLNPTSEMSKTALGLAREAILDPSALIYAHNAPFEVAVTKYCLERDTGLPVPAIEKWRCTAAMCRRAGVPPALADAAKFLKLGQDKDKRGTALIQIFSNLTFNITLHRGKGKAAEKMKVTDPLGVDPIPWDWSLTVGGEVMTLEQAWAYFLLYCGQDVKVEREVRRALVKFELEGDHLDGFLFDMRMNDRGIPVDVPGLQRAQRLIREHEDRLSARFREITKLNPTQVDKCQAWFNANGYPYGSLKAEMVAKANALEDSKMTVEAKEALAIKSKLSFAAVKKVSALLAWVCPDGKVRGAFIYHGAMKTGRWVSVGPQFQNMKRPPKWLKPRMEQLYRAVTEWADLDDIEFLFGDPYEMLACCARYFVREEEAIYDIDFAQVEARILPALIECDRILDKFRQGEDIYMDVANALKVDRDMGKVISLLCQFGGGWQAVKLPLGDKISDEDAHRAVAVYRKENPEVVKGWRLFQDKFVEALENPGKWIEVTKYVKFGYTRKSPFPCMKMLLPSGRHICYPSPAADPITMVKVGRKVKKKGTIEDVFKWERTSGHLESKAECAEALWVGKGAMCDTNAWVESFFHTHELSFYGHIEGAVWGRVKTYGGDLLQSATQGTGMDFLMHGCVVAEKRGFEPFFVVHDQALAHGRGGLQNFIDALCTRPAWFPDFPLEADGRIALSYSKD